ncbi:MAG: hypothetical protein GC180_11815 [Bacteroidetes bacterium]|nr:hypothetical protein [Bacteroidota bacterium]
MKTFAFLLSLFFCTSLLAQTAVQAGDKVTYLDEDGTVLNSNMFKRGTSFSEGLAAVDVSHAGEKPLWFFIGTDYSVKIPYGYDSVGNFHHGLCPVKKEGIWFYIGKDGLAVINEDYSEAGNFHNGMAVVTGRNGTFIIDTLGHPACFGFYEKISQIGDSCFGALPKGEQFWSLFNLNGDTLLNDSFYYVAPSIGGQVLVNRLGGYRFLNKKGDLLFGRAFLEATPFSNGWACIRQEDDWFLMDEQGKVKKDTRLKSPVRMQYPLTPAQNYNGKYGVLNLEGNWVY